MWTDFDSLLLSLLACKCQSCVIMMVKDQQVDLSLDFYWPTPAGARTAKKSQGALMSSLQGPFYRPLLVGQIKGPHQRIGSQMSAKTVGEFLVFREHSNRISSAMKLGGSFKERLAAS